MSDFLADCAERIIVLGIVHRRIINRFHKFILWLGIPLHRVQDTKPNEFCRIVSEFALEYRTTRERVIQQLEKKANHRERNKTRGKMITEVSYRTRIFFFFFLSFQLKIFRKGHLSSNTVIGAWTGIMAQGGINCFFFLPRNQFLFLLTVALISRSLVSRRLRILVVEGASWL